MNPSLRRAVVGAIAGSIGSTILAPTLGHVALGIALGTAVGALLALVQRSADRAPIDIAMESAALGVPLWALVNVVVLPLAAGERPRWTAAEMQGEVRSLVGWILFLVA